MRLARGKPSFGDVRLKIERHADRIVFTCSDDGAGIDVDAVRRAAVSHGVLSAASASELSVEHALELIFCPGVTTSTSKQYFNLGDMRLINNRWGSDALNCTGTMQSVYINADKTLGWSFNRPTCGGKRADPDFPEIEFGVAPFGNTSSLLTTPPFSSTTLLPIQIKNLTSASVTLNNFTTTFQNPSYWDSNFEFWISQEDPTTNANAGVYAEIIMFLGWESNRLNTAAGGWTCDKTGTVTAGASTAGR